MNKTAVIEVLESLISYINDEWDKEDYEKDIKESTEALEYAIKVIKSNNKQVGTLVLDGKKYFVSK